MKSTTMFEVSV